MFVPKSLAVWLLILALAIANGTLREAVLLEALPRSSAFVASGALLIACVLATSFLTIRWLGSLTPIQYIWVGVLWLGMTLAFEFSFGMLLRNQNLATMLEGYRFKDGNIWPLVLLSVAIAPVVAAYARGLLAPRGSP